MSAGMHLVHIILTILFFPWALVYICCAISAGNSRKRMEDRKRDEQIELLKQLVREKK